MSFHFWRRQKEPDVDIDAAKAAVVEAIELRAVGRIQAEQSRIRAEHWENRLHTNGFAELVESLFVKDQQKHSNDT